MIIEPAIDLKDQKVVRLHKGDFDTVHQVAEDPVAVAKEFAQAGATVIHMVDLDGARSGKRVNGEIVKRVIAESGMKIEMGGGIRCMDDLKAVDEMGVWRFVIGSAAVTDPEFVAEAVKAYGDRIAVGVDAKNGEVKTSGWESGSGIHYIDFAKKMEALGVKTLIFTDIDTDGMLSGPSYQSLENLRNAVSCQIVASGGVSCNQDIENLAQMGLYGAIIGKAYYAGTIDLPQAVRCGGDQTNP
ncbi:MAG: 1-(5-phosphoribosyl)-5-[(5-phosphoribosylamino)methylideneamino]imidazole-4-carboxamide isomerase [Oscillospiraceae bacterium]|nr:1-(5-phosphoribosyl)-5-[(5-phosphoribosylamino)methylideneamino]imidazole-4-carboxamide isomerase [Oscillospiraceae bacterium]